MDIKHALEVIIRDGFILVFNQDKLNVVKTAEALLAAGVNNMEVTCRISRPLEKIKQLRKQLPDFVTGAASLIDNPRFLEIHNKQNSDDPLPAIEQVIEAGSNYLVSAVNFRRETYEKYAGKVPMIPGCGTANEIVSQFSLGANLVKIFPAEQLGGPAFVKAVDPAIHKIISLVPTGGTNAANIPPYVDAGILVLGGSFSAIDKKIFREIIEKQDYKFLSTEFKKIKELIDEVRAKKWPKIDFKKASLKQISEVTGRNFNV